MGIEPTHKGFADLSLTTWVPRRDGTTFKGGLRKNVSLGCLFALCKAERNHTERLD